MTRLGVIPSAWTGNRGFTKLSCSRKPSESCCQNPQRPMEKQGVGFQMNSPPARNRRWFWIASPALMTALAGVPGFLIIAEFTNPVSTPKSVEELKLVAPQPAKAQSVRLLCADHVNGVPPLRLPRIELRPAW